MTAGQFVLSKLCIYILLVLILGACNCFQCPHRVGVSIGEQLEVQVRIGGALYAGFDEEFAEAISKPLPAWYVKEQQQAAAYQRELEENKKRVREDFEKKYSREAAEYISQNNVNTANITAEQCLEEKDAGFYLPGFFEVFPELRLKWPVWARKRDGSPIECKTDKDCRFPQACCNHPIIPGNKFCCTGMGQRVMERAFVGQEIQGDLASGRKVGQDDVPPPKKAREPWRPDPY
jgi:hypothetical protein